jgi:predicted DNA-binding transcriptional regulator YafY
MPDYPPFRMIYKNWRGETAERSVLPLQVYFGSTEYHPEPQWLMEAHDFEKNAPRIFAMRDMLPIR